MFTCTATPVRLAFEESVDISLTWLILDCIVDGFFMADIVVNFYSAFYDNEYVLVDNRKSIAKSYLRTWFIVDIMAVLPLDYALRTSDFNSLARIARLPRLYRLVKMSRLVRMLKIVKDRNKLVKYLNEILKISIGFERLLFFFLIFFVLCHVVACFWIMFSKLSEDSFPDTWIS